MIEYDFKAARTLRMKLVKYLRRMLDLGYTEDGTWDWELKKQIDEIDQEIADAHSSVNGKIVAGQGDYPVVHIENIISPIVPQWTGSINQLH